MKTTIANPVCLLGFGQEHQKSKIKNISKNLKIMFATILITLAFSCAKDDEVPPSLLEMENTKME